MITLQLTNRSRPSKGQESHTSSAGPRPPPWKQLLFGAGLLLLLIVATVAGVFIHFYLQFSRIIDARLDGNVFGNPAVILAAPSELHCGQTTNARSIAASPQEGRLHRGPKCPRCRELYPYGQRTGSPPGPRVFLPKWSNGRRSGEAGIPRRSPRVDYCTRQHDRLEDLLA